MNASWDRQGALQCEPGIQLLGFSNPAGEWGYAYHFTVGPCAEHRLGCMGSSVILFACAGNHDYNQNPAPQLGTVLQFRDRRWNGYKYGKLALAGGAVELFFLDTNTYVTSYSYPGTFAIALVEIMGWPGTAAKREKKCPRPGTLLLKQPSGWHSAAMQ
jgi:hypothetical protein